MRPLELLLLLGLALGFLWLVARPRTGRWLGPVLFGLLVALLHLAQEGYRWGMVPAYVAGVALVTLALRRRRHEGVPPPRSVRGAGLLGLLLVGLSAALGWALPVPTLPTPGGPYQVGTVTYHLVDPAREEAYTPEVGDRREIMVQIWYPATPAPGTPSAPWIERADRFAPIVASFVRLPAWTLGHLALVRTHAFRHAPPVAEPARFPVVVSAHGWTGFRAVNTNQMEALASHGYVAVGIDHTFGALLTVFPDGRTVPYNPSALPEGVPAAEYDRAAEQLVHTYSDDVRFVLDELARLEVGEAIGVEPQADAPGLTGRLDLARVGLFGHSTGGGAIVRACSEDARCRAGVGMDAWVEPVPDEMIERGLAQPFLFMRSEPWTRNGNDTRLTRLYDASTGERYRLGIAGTKHRDFTMQGLLSPLTPRLGLSGRLPARYTLDIVTTYLLAFFDHTLKGEAAPLLAGPASPYPEVKFEARR